MCKIIFLDIDGVMNFGSMTKEETITVKDIGRMSTRAVSNLNKLTDDTGANIVISSTWRLFNDMPEVLDAFGITGKYIGSTPNLSSEFSLRGNEIYGWMKMNLHKMGLPREHEFKQYVIFDDDSDMLLWQAHNYIRVDNFTGLTHNHTYRAQNILK